MKKKLECIFIAALMLFLFINTVNNEYYGGYNNQTDAKHEINAKDNNIEISKVINEQSQNTNLVNVSGSGCAINTEFNKLTNLTHEDVDTVTDSQYTFSVGGKYDFDYFSEEQTGYSHYGGGILVNGCPVQWEFLSFKDIKIAVTTYNPIIGDYSGDNFYIGRIYIDTPRFETSRGIHVGSDIDDIFTAYDTDGYTNIDTFERTGYYDNDDRVSYYTLITDGVRIDFVFNEYSKKITSIHMEYLTLVME